MEIKELIRTFVSSILMKVESALVEHRVILPVHPEFIERLLVDHL
jgi:hypothetical protein